MSSSNNNSNSARYAIISTSPTTRPRSAFQSKLAGVRFYLRAPSPFRPGHAHTGRLCGNAIEHLASGEHRSRVKRFMGKYGGGMDRVNLFRIFEVDFDKVAWSINFPSTLLTGDARLMDLFVMALLPQEYQWPLGTAKLWVFSHRFLIFLMKALKEMFTLDHLLLGLTYHKAIDLILLGDHNWETLYLLKQESLQD